MKTMKKLIALGLAAATLFAGSLASAKTMEPEEARIDRLAGKTVHATVGAYDEDSKTFTVTIYENDHYDEDEIKSFGAGDTILAGGELHKVKELYKIDDDVIFRCDDGEDIYFSESYEDEDEIIARSTMDDRIFMRAVAFVKLPAGEGIVYEDNTDPDLDAKAIIHVGLENVLKAKDDKETNSIGFDFYSTLITLNENLEIVKIHQDFDVSM